MSLSVEIKATLSLVEEAAASGAIWDRAKTKSAAGDYWSPCPLHAETTASFHVTEKGGAGGVFHCFGCHAQGSIVDFVMARDGLDFRAAVRKLGSGIARKPDPVRQAEIERERAERRAEEDAEIARQAAAGLEKARAIWRAAVIGDPRLAAYLAGRGIRLDVIGGVPKTLRLHPDLPCYVGSDDQGRPRMVHRGPAMVAAMGRRGAFVGVHRTWIDGPARARSDALDGAKVPKQMLGARGDIFGAPVILTPPAPLVIVGEGIETTLAGLTAWRLRFASEPASAEAALTLDALAGPQDPDGRPDGRGRHGRPLPSPRPDLAATSPGWIPAPHVTRAIILADPSTKCPETARLHGERAAAKVGPRCADGVTLAVPKGRWDHDDDFADLAKMGDF